MDPELVRRTVPKGLHRPNLQQQDTSDIWCTTQQCSGPTAFPHLHKWQWPRQWRSQQNIEICWRQPNKVLELQEDLNRLVDWANTWQINSDIDKCAVMHIGHNNIQHNYTMANQQLIATEEQHDLGITITRDLKWQKQTKKRCKDSKQSTRIDCQQLQLQEHKTHAPTLQVHCLTPPGICSSALVLTSM